MNTIEAHYMGDVKTRTGKKYTVWSVYRDGERRAIFSRPCQRAKNIRKVTEVAYSHYHKYIVDGRIVGA